MFTRILAAAALAGVFAGLLLTAIQQIEIEPLIRLAEMREMSSAALQAPDAALAHEAWTPHAGWQRSTATSVANIVLATAFALLLGAAMALRRHSGWRAGLVWGVAGYVVLFVAPAASLPPALPGTDSAPLADRQLWWVTAAAFSAAGLWLAAFAKEPLLRVVGVALMAVPQLVGAPTATDDLAQADDAQAFIRATYLANGALWVTIGVVTGALAKHWNRRRIVDDGRASEATHS